MQKSQILKMEHEAEGMDNEITNLREKVKEQEMKNNALQMKVNDLEAQHGTRMA